MSRLQVIELPLEGLKLIQRTSIGDHRGFLCRMFCQQELAKAGWNKSIAQINHTYTAKKGTVRGLHFQHPPHAEMKLVSCLRGEIWDVAVDIRAGSPTFLHWHAERLSADNGRALLIPEGFAHGFQALMDQVELLYIHSHPYTSSAEAGVRADDSILNITWPIPMSEISKRDALHPILTHDFKGIVL